MSKSGVLSQEEEDVIENDMIAGEIYGTTFEEILLWSIPCFLGILKEVIEDDPWDEVAVEYGYEPNDAHVVKVSCIFYIELIEWHFDLMNKKGDKNAPEANEASTKKAP
ncbi:hypothetical protein Hanom_Chr16g01482931 [Helianthus anomalus]